MEIHKILVLRGPNVWAHSPIIEVWVNLRPHLDVPSSSFPGFVERVKSWLPSMIEHDCGTGERGGFFERLDTGTYLGHVLEHVTLELQSLVGPAVGYGRTRETVIPGLYRVAFRYAAEELGLACLDTAIRLLTCARTGAAFDIKAELALLREISETWCHGPSTQAIISAAKERGIPCVRISKYSLVQLGHGSQQRRIWTAETDQTSAIAESIAQDKELTRKLLHQAGVPVPQGSVVTSADAAWEAAEDLGLPVVVKPREGNHGHGVSIDLTTREQVVAAFAIANAEDAGVIVEQCIAGHHHRVLVVGSRVVAAAEGDPDYVTGDGRSTVGALVELANQQPDRGDAEVRPFSHLDLDAIAVDLLRRQQLTVDSVAALGQRVILHYNGDLPRDVTPRVHPEVARAAVLAAKTVGLNIAGVDFVLKDISCSLAEQQGAVLEVNASPSLLMHLRPQFGQPQPVGEAILSELYPPNQNGRIPIVAVSGTNGKSTVIAQLAAQIAAASPALRLGIASSDGLFVNGRALVSGVATDYESIARLLVNPLVDLAIAEMEPRTVLEQGIAFDRSQVAVVTNLGSSDHLGLPAMTRERLLLAERCGVEGVLADGTAVLNADDAEVLEMAPKCRGKVLLFSRDADRPELTQHRAQGGRTVALRGTTLCFEEGATLVARLPLFKGQSAAALENLLASSGAAWSLGLTPKAFAHEDNAAGVPITRQHLLTERMHFKTHEGRWLFLTMARNASALEASLLALADRQESFARRIAIQTHLPADWRDEDAFTAGRRLAEAFDEVRLRLEMPLAHKNAEGTEAPNEQPGSPLAEAFARGVSRVNPAKLTILPLLANPARSTLLVNTDLGDLLYVQLGSFGNFASVALAEEGPGSFGSSEAAPSEALRNVDR